MEYWSGGVVEKNISVHSQVFVGWVEADRLMLGFVPQPNLPKLLLSSTDQRVAETQHERDPIC
jgi:hypothetical protein